MILGLPRGWAGLCHSRRRWETSEYTGIEWNLGGVRAE